MKVKNAQPKEKAQKKPAIPNREGFSRASFLYQASQSFVRKNEALSRIYSRSMNSVTKKTVLKLSPTLKRTICKQCNRLQTPGIYASIRVENSDKPSEVYQVKCKCGEIKRYPVGKDRNYELFATRDENISC